MCSDFGGETPEADDEADDVTSGGRDAAAKAPVAPLLSPPVRLTISEGSSTFSTGLTLDNPDFLTYLRVALSKAGFSVAESPRLLLWSMCVPDTRPDAIESSLLLIYDNTLAVFGVGQPENEHGFPSLDFQLSVDLANVTRILRGYQGNYVRVDELEPDTANKDQPVVHSLVFFLMDPAASTQLLDCLDVYNTADYLNLESSREEELLAFVRALNTQQQSCSNLDTPVAEILFYAVALLLQSGLTVVLSVLVTRTHLLLLDENVTKVPLPTAANLRQGQVSEDSCSASTLSSSLEMTGRHMHLPFKHTFPLYIPGSTVSKFN